MSNHTVACFGEILLRISSPHGQPLMQRESFDWFVGGAEANVAVGLTHLGLNARVISSITDNKLGDNAIGQLRKHGVDTSCIRRAEGRLGLYFHTAGTGRRAGEVIYDRQNSTFANTSIDDYDIDACLKGADWLHISGVTPAIGERAANAACVMAEEAVKAGVGVSFDFNHRAKMWARWGGDPTPLLNRLVKSTTLLFGNDHDIALLLGDAAKAGRTLDSAAIAFAAFERLQCITSAFRTTHTVERQMLGAKIVTRKEEAQTPVVEMRNIVDRIGGGDAYAAAVIAGFLAKLPAKEIVHNGLAASVHKHAIRGEFPCATPSDVEAMQQVSVVDVKR